jgi:CubicO group peptidase (beta-lactamase class C family)
LSLDAQHWQDRLTLLRGKHGVVGATLAVRKGDVTLEAAAGVLNLRTNQPVTPDSLFQVGSIGKVWTATLIMQLVDEGLLDLDAPVVTYLPTFQVADAEVTRTVTSRHLLSHSSGIDGDLFLDTGRGDDCVEKYVAAMSTLTQVHQLGATMSYCNSGFTLLGRIIEVLRGKSWDEVLRERLFAPLGLESAGTLPEEALLWGAATGHLVTADADAPVVTTQWGIFRSAGPAGLIHTTARDQLAFAALHLAGGTAAGGRVLSEESVAAMQQPQVAIPDTFTLGSHWGLGWILMDWNGQRIIGHDGGTIGQASFLRLLPAQSLSVSLLTNGGSGTRNLFEDLYREIFGELADVEMPRQPEPGGAFVTDPTRFTGRYKREGVEVVIRVHSAGKLTATVHSTSPLASAVEEEVFELLPCAPNVLLARSEGAKSYVPVVFFELGGEQYFHMGARANRRISTQP